MRIENTKLGEGCWLEDRKGEMRPNDNILGNGLSGSGKTESIMLPAVLDLCHSSAIATWNKRARARELLRYLRSKGYKTILVDLANTKLSTGTFDPLRYVTSYQDVEELCKSILRADPDQRKTKDIYWNDSAENLLKALILLTLTVVENATMSDVLRRFDHLIIKEDGKGIKTSLDEAFEDLEIAMGKCPAVTAFEDFQQLPYNTAGCVRDSLAKVLRKVFPESIRDMIVNFALALH